MRLLRLSPSGAEPESGQVFSLDLVKPVVAEVGARGVCVALESSWGQHLRRTSGRGLITAGRLDKCYGNLPPVPGEPLAR